MMDKYIKSTARLEDMSAVGRLRITRDGDGDIIITINEQTDNELVGVGSSVEFCTSGMGGGGSPRTFQALLNLMEAMEEDNLDASSQSRAIVGNNND